MADSILPPDVERKIEYDRANYKDQPAKHLRSDGSVTESLPVDITDASIEVTIDHLNKVDEVVKITDPVAVSNMIPAVETGLATSAKQLADNHQVQVSNIANTPLVNVSALATSAKQLADGHNVSVSNMIPAVETGLATSANQTNGDQKSSVSGRNLGKTAQVSPMRALSTFDQIRLCGTPFHGVTKDINFWSETGTTAGGSVTQGGGQVILATTTASGSKSIYVSVRAGRYISGSSNKFRGILRFPDVGTASNNNVREFGPATATDGFLFQLNGNVFNIVVRKSGVADQIIPKASWTGTYAAAFTLDTNVHTYEIQYTNSSAWFFIDDNIVHTVKGDASPSTSTLSFPVRASNANTGVGPAVSLEIRTMAILRMGHEKSRPHWKYSNNVVAATVLKYGPGTIHGVINGNNKGTLALYDCVTTGALTGQIILFDLVQCVGFIPFGIDGLDFYTGLIMVQTDATSETTVIYE